MLYFVCSTYDVWDDYLEGGGDLSLLGEGQDCFGIHDHACTWSAQGVASMIYGTAFGGDPKFQIYPTSISIISHHHVLIFHFIKQGFDGFHFDEDICMVFIVLFSCGHFLSRFLIIFLKI